MANTIYLVRKDRESTKEKTEWVQMDGAEFYRFTKSPEGKGRHFIHLTDDISYEADEIYIEAGYEEYRMWKKEENHHRYLAGCAEEVHVISADIPVKAGGDTLLETLEDEKSCIEELIAEKEEEERLHKILSGLESEERELLTVMYFGERARTEMETAKLLHISRDAVKRRKKKVFLKISKLMRSKM
ncbi:MAG: hypothetical protein LUE24_12310 [Lachnospiraceae bacterium]|nr:hypothetical protein [Lachnospiraceae bacterium]